MKWALTIWLFALGVSSTAQTFPKGEQSHSGAKSEWNPTPAELSQALISKSRSEKEKVTAIFNWITENISYYRPDPKKARKNGKALDNNHEIYFDDGMALPPLNERVAAKVISERRAVCEGYARLFQSLCDHAGIRSQIITGYARTKWNGPAAGFRSNHTWNAVNIDSVWYLLDVTWASGFISRSTGDFIRHFDDYYFLTEPSKFIEHHYPDDLRLAFMDNPPVIPEFRITPFRQKSFTKYAITSFFPSRGVIETVVGDTIQLELETLAAERNSTIASDSLWEPGSLPQTSIHAFVQPVENRDKSKVYYRFAVNSENLQWLYVMYNNDAVLRYRLNVRKPGTTTGYDR